MADAWRDTSLLYTDTGDPIRVSYPSATYTLSLYGIPACCGDGDCLTDGRQVSL